jgi:hypothetical protein
MFSAQTQQTRPQAAARSILVRCFVSLDPATLSRPANTPATPARPVDPLDVQFVW